jgi:glycosyltransferase 2 family protein
MGKILLRGAISFAFLGLLFFMVREDIPVIASTLRGMDHGLAVLSVLIFLVAVLTLAIRLRLIFRVMEIPISFAESAQLTLVGYFFNNFLPTSVGGDIVKAMCAARVTKSGVKSATGVLMDRIFGLFTFILIPSVTLLFHMKNIRNPLIPAMVYGLLFFSVACFFLIFHRGTARKFRFVEGIALKMKIGGKLRELYEQLHSFKHHKRAAAAAMLLSIVGQIISVFTLFVMARALGTDVEPVYFFLLVPVVHLVAMLPSLNGLGIREGAYTYFLTPYMGKEYAFALGILWLGLLILLSLIGGVIYLIRHDYHIRFKGGAPQEEGVT